MQGYRKGSCWASLPIHYNGYVDASMQVYNKGSVGPKMSVHYNV
jgi:hypothetical protein